MSNNFAVHINPLNAELNPICHLLALVGAHHILHVSRITDNKHSLLYRVYYVSILKPSDFFCVVRFDIVQDMQCRYNITLRRVRATTVAVDKQ